MERVSSFCGKNPLLFVAPRGYDDANTAIITEIAAVETYGYAVINRGFQCSNIVDVSKDLANCDNLKHCKEDVVKEEFLDPIIRYKNRIMRRHPTAYIFYIYGLGAEYKLIDRDIGYILQRGSGATGHICERWVSELVMYMLETSERYKVYEAGGDLWDMQKVPHLFRTWYSDYRVQSIKIEVIDDLRSSEDKAIVTGQILAMVAKELLDFNDFELPYDYKIKRI